MEDIKIDIPEHIQQICREFGDVARKHGLYHLSGTFKGTKGWSGEINFNWDAGRHNEDSNEIRISSTMHVSTLITPTS